MGSITIHIRLNEDIRYTPSPLVRQGDAVTFKLEDVPYAAEVRFPDGTCLSTPGPYELDGNSLLLSSSLQTVAATAAEGQYPFTVTIFDGSSTSTSLRVGGQHEVKKGGIDVSTEPPKDPEKK
ncbi:hypothetical protein [Pyxidicoccus sp. MSG2]|uniref:hypothetical protein n=1 Tax=Pyxidicoccus sp. MSG2 TaxID=2996790 RepID=UPI00226F7AED|nr:hypothetical protein [Pyxidicoccus sp. MSG2]MCY1021492.1 hypothetical protein [Pyxidicoccus sp. MSG2]